MNALSRYSATYLLLPGNLPEVQEPVLLFSQILSLLVLKNLRKDEWDQCAL